MEYLTPEIRLGTLWRVFDADVDVPEKGAIVAEVEKVTDSKVRVDLPRGHIEVLGGDIASARHRDRTCPRIAYMPQGLGRNLYPTLSVRENIDFFGRLFGHDAAESARRIKTLTRATGLYPFIDRPAGKLSGGMKQKLGLCSALIHDPDLLILDEPTTGVDPGARDEFWRILIELSRGEGVTIFLLLILSEKYR